MSMTDKKMTDAEWLEAYRKAGGTYTGGPILPPGEQAPPPGVHEEDIDWGGDGEPSIEWTRNLRSVPPPSKLGAKAKTNGKAPVIPEPTLNRMADVQPEKTVWLWRRRVAEGKLTMLVGDPGLGKGWVSLAIAAHQSTGRDWPDGTPGPEPGNVILLSAEDTPADVIRPRLDRLGADVTRIFHLPTIKIPATGVDRLVTLADIPSIELAVERVQARLVVVDPTNSFLPDGIDAHRDTEIRQRLMPFADLAERHRVSIVAVHHLNKSVQQSAIHRLAGAIAYAAVARVVLAVASDPANPLRRFLMPVKNNLSQPAAILAYSLEEGEDGPDGIGQLVWESVPVSGVDVNGVLGPATNGRDREEQTEAGGVITDLLESEDWPLDARDALKAGEAHGIHARTMQRTARHMGIRTSRVGGTAAKGRWVWHRPVLDKGDT